MYKDFKRDFFLIFLFINISVPAKSQDSLRKNITSPRFFEFNIQSFNRSNNSIYPIGIDTPRNKSDLIYNIILRYPIYIGKSTRVFGEIKHNNEFLFGYYSIKDSELEPLELYETASSIALSHKFKNNWRFTSILNLSINSNKLFFVSINSVRYSIATFIENKRKTKSIGIGVLASFNNRTTILPFIKYKSKLNSKWVLDVLIPSKLLMSYSTSSKFRYIFGFKGDAASYYISNNGQIDEMYLNTFYRRINISTLIGFESKFNRWFGVRTEFGITSPIRMELSNYSNDTIHDFNSKLVPYINCGLFLSLPN